MPISRIAFFKEYLIIELRVFQIKKLTTPIEYKRFFFQKMALNIKQMFYSQSNLV